MNRPPEIAIENALIAAAQSPCAKSKRGVAAYVRTSPISVVGVGFNGPPGDIECDGSESCRGSCGQRCVHAEIRAMRSVAHLRPLLNKWVAIVHVKIDDRGELVAGGGPSCWQCSREILDVGVAGIWLYERGGIGRLHDYPDEWVFYDALAFHRATLEACEIGGPR